MDFKKLISQLDQLNEADVKHKGTYGTSYQGDDDEDDDKKTAPASTEKRGRGRPKKAGGDAANAAGYSGAKDLQSMMVGNIPKDSKELKKLPKIKNTLKDWIESIDEQMMLAEAELAVQPIGKPGQNFLIKDPANPSASAITTSDPAVVDAAKKGTLSMQKPGAAPASGSGSQVGAMKEGEDEGAGSKEELAKRIYGLEMSHHGNYGPGDPKEYALLDQLKAQFAQQFPGENAFRIGSEISRKEQDAKTALIVSRLPKPMFGNVNTKRMFGGDTKPMFGQRDESMSEGKDKIDTSSAFGNMTLDDIYEIARDNGFPDPSSMLGGSELKLAKYVIRFCEKYGYEALTGDKLLEVGKKYAGIYDMERPAFLFAKAVADAWKNGGVKDSLDLDESYMAEGKDEGKPGKNFAKIAKSAGKHYGSKEAGERVAGAVRAKLMKQGMAEGRIEIKGLAKWKAAAAEQGYSVEGPSKPFGIYQAYSKSGVHKGTFKPDGSPPPGSLWGNSKPGMSADSGSLFVEQAMAESKTAKRDNRAEAAGKKVTKDLEYDMKHKGKDDNKAERAGKKVTKDIEYDEKKTPSMAHIKKMCKDGKTVAQICKMHPNCNQAELKKMVADCKKKMVAEGMEMKHTFAILDDTLIDKIASMNGAEVDPDAGSVETWDENTARQLIAFAQKNPQRLKRTQSMNTGGMKPRAQHVGGTASGPEYNLKEGMDQRLEAARSEGRAHGLRGHQHCGNNYDDMEEARCYHDGYKAGLDECYGQMPIQGYVGEESDHDVVDTMASYGAETLEELDMDEGNAFTAALARTPPGGKFSVGGNTFTDRSGYNAKIDEFAFESLDRQLNALLSEGMTVSISKGQENSPDSVSINASDAEADSLLAFVKQAGLGIFGGDDHGGMQDAVVTSAPNTASSDAIEVVDDHDGMLSLIRKMAGQGAAQPAHDHSSEDYADEEETCNECGMAYESCGGNHGGKMVDEQGTPNQNLAMAAEDNPPDTGAAETEQEVQDTAQANSSAASFDQAQAAPQAASDLATESEDDEEEDEEGGYDAEGNQRPGGPYDAGGHYVGGYKGHDDRIKGRDLDEDELEESYANSADDTFESDIEFMTNIISGGANKRKSTGQTTIPVVSTQFNRLGSPMKESTDLLTQWKKLSGLK